MATKKRQKCQKPGVPAQVWINNNLTKTEVTSCKPQISEEDPPVQKMSKTELGTKRGDCNVSPGELTPGLEISKGGPDCGMNCDGRRISNITDDTRCSEDNSGHDESCDQTKDAEGHGTYVSNSYLTLAYRGSYPPNDIKEQSSDLTSHGYTDCEGECDVFDPEDNLDVSDLKRDYEQCDVFDTGDNLSVNDIIKRDYEQCDVFDTGDNLSVNDIKRDYVVNNDDLVKDVDRKDNLLEQDLAVINIDTVEESDCDRKPCKDTEVCKQKSNTGSGDKMKTLQKQNSIQISEYGSGDYKAIDHKSMDLGDQLRLDFERAQSLHHSLPQLSRNSFHSQPNQIMDLRSAQSLPHVSQISKDVTGTFIRKHRRTSSLQLARCLSSDLSTIPEELEKRRSVELETSGYDFRHNLPRASTVTNVSFEKWDDSGRFKNDHVVTKNDNFMIKSDIQEIPLCLQTTHGCATGVGAKTDNNQLETGMQNRDSVKPEIPSKPKKGDKNFQKFKEAGEQIRKSVKTKKHKDINEHKAPGQSSSQHILDCSKVSKAKHERNTRRKVKVFHSKKTRDANCKISRQESQESSQEDVSKNAEKTKRPTSGIYRATRSRGVELFKSLREKNSSEGGSGGGGDNVRCTENVSFKTECKTELNHNEDTSTDNNVSGRNCSENTTNFKTNVEQCRITSHCDLNDCQPKNERDVDEINSKYGSEEFSINKEDTDTVATTYHSCYSTCENLSSTIKENIDDKSEVLRGDTIKTDCLKICHGENIRNDDSSTSFSDKMDDMESETTTEESDRVETTSDEYTSSTESSYYSTSDKFRGSAEDTDGSDKSSIDVMTMQLDWKRRAYSRTHDDSEDDREWTERSKKITANLEWIRTEITELKKQDQSLMRQFLQLRSTIHAIKRKYGNSTAPTDTKSCGNFLHLQSSSLTGFNDLSRFGSSTSINNALMNIENDHNSTLGSLDGSSSGNEYLPEFRARTVSLVQGSRPEATFVKPRTMTFSSGSKNTERGVFESGEVAC